MPKRITSKKFCKKTPPVSGGTLAQATRGTCRLGHSRQGLAAWASAGMWPCQRRRLTASPSVGPAANGEAGISTWRHAGNGGGGTLGSTPASRQHLPPLH
jgi:hypothetical protein